RVATGHDLRFDLVLETIRQLEPSEPEELDPVVLGRVVGGGGHHAGRDLELTRATRPASWAVRNAPPGVGPTPARIALPPPPTMPSTSASSRIGPDARVSRPITNVGGASPPRHSPRQ